VCRFRHARSSHSLAGFPLQCRHPPCPATLPLLSVHVVCVRDYQMRFRLFVELAGSDGHLLLPNCSPWARLRHGHRPVVVKVYDHSIAGKKLPFESAIISSLRSVRLNGVWALNCGSVSRHPWRRRSALGRRRPVSWWGESGGWKVLAVDLSLDAGDQVDAYLFTLTDLNRGMGIEWTWSRTGSLRRIPNLCH
jgi:hypothetical protein